MAGFQFLEFCPVLVADPAVVIAPVAARFLIRFQCIDLG